MRPRTWNVRHVSNATSESRRSAHGSDRRSFAVLALTTPHLLGCHPRPSQLAARAALGALQPHSVRTLALHNAYAGADAGHAMRRPAAEHALPRQDGVGGGVDRRVQRAIQAAAGGRTRWPWRSAAAPRRIARRAIIDAALADLDRAIKLEPKNADHYRPRARLSRAARHRSRHPRFRSGRRAQSAPCRRDPAPGQAYRAAGNLERAIVDYDLLVRINPRTAGATIIAASPGASCRIRSRPRRFQPDDPDRWRQCLGHYNRGLVLYDMRQYDRAIRDLDRAINVSPDHAPSFNLRGLAYAAIGETRRAIQDFDQAVQLDAQLRQGVRQSRQHLPEHATSTSGRSPTTARRSRLKPKDAYSLYSRGLAMRALGHEEEAQVDIAKAKEIEPGIGP